MHVIRRTALAALLALSAGLPAAAQELSPRDALKCPSPVTAVAYSPDGATLAALCHDGSIAVWDLTKGDPAVILKGGTKRVTALAWSPDGKTLASGGTDKKVHLWDLATGKETLSLDHQDEV